MYLLRFFVINFKFVVIFDENVSIIVLIRNIIMSLV